MASKLKLKAKALAIGSLFMLSAVWEMERPVTVNPQSDVFLEGVRFAAVLEVLE